MNEAEDNPESLARQGNARASTGGQRGVEELKWFRALVDQSKDAFEVIDPATGRFLEVNEQNCRELGYTREELLALRVFDIDPMVDPAGFPSHVETLRQAGTLTWNGLHRRKDGSTFPVEVSLKYVQLDCDYLVASSRDITERRRTEEALAGSEKKFRELVQRMQIGLVAHGPDTRILLSNPMASQLLGLTPDQLRGKTALDPAWCFVHEDGTPMAVEEYPVNRALAAPDGRVADLIVGIRRPDRESPTWVQCNCHTVRHGGGEIEQVLVTFADITERKEAVEQLRKLTRAVEQCPVSIVITDVQGDIEYVNPKFTALTGYSAAEALGKNPRILKTDDLPPEAYRNLWETILAGKVWQGEFHNRKKNGETYWESATISPVFNAGGKITHFLAVKEDTTEIKRAQLERQAAERRIAEQAALLDQANDSIIQRDLDHHLLYWNQGAERIFGWKKEEVLGKSLCELLVADQKAFDLAMQAVLNNGEWSGELEKRTKANKKVTLNSRWTLLRDHAGQPKSILAIETDITEKKRIEQQFLRAQRMESLGTLAGGLAHDLNNALSPILMAIDILKLEIQDPGLLETLATMRASAQRGADMVKQVLSFARGTDGQALPVKLSYLAEELRKIIADTFPRDIQIEVVSPRGLWNVQADPTQLHQVIMNLCLNARDAMPKGGKLTLKLENQVLDEVFVRMNPHARPGPYVTLQVTDTGEGIPPEIQNRIFDPFFTTKEFGKGTGLGLSTALGLVKGCGGFINLYSEVGRGTTFKLFFPALTGDAEKCAAETEPAGLPTGNGELILVVDDEEQLRNIVKRTLERFGYRVVLAQNGAEAVAIYGQNRNTIAAVLTDMAMPIMDGPSTIIALKSMNSQLTIISSSGLPANGQLTKVLGAGVKYFIPKPYDAGTLLRVLAQALADAKATAA